MPIRTHDLCDTGAVLYQLSFQDHWELVFDMFTCSNADYCRNAAITVLIIYMKLLDSDWLRTVQLICTCEFFIKPNCIRRSGSCNFSSLKTHSCKLIPNWTRNRMITYTNITRYEYKYTAIMFSYLYRSARACKTVTLAYSLMNLFTTAVG